MYSYMKCNLVGDYVYYQITSVSTRSVYVIKQQGLLTATVWVAGEPTILSHWKFFLLITNLTHFSQCIYFTSLHVSSNPVLIIRRIELYQYIIWYTGLFISPSGTFELDCATTKTYTAERSISIGRESLKVFLY